LNECVRGLLFQRKQGEMLKKENAEADELRAMLNFQQIGLIEYFADTVIQRRVGKCLSDSAAPLSIDHFGGVISAVGARGQI
jgi:hypothetical protein